MDNNFKILKIFPLGIVSMLCLAYFFSDLFFSSFLPKVPMFFRDGDFYWIIKTGDWVLKNHSVPHYNILGNNIGELSKIHFVSYQWLFEVVISLLNKCMGFHGIVWGCVSLLTLTLGLLGYNLYIRGFRGFPDIVFALTANLFILYMFSNARPFVISMFFGALLSVAITKYNNKSKLAYWFLFPLIFLLWTNSHLGFIFGLVWMLLEMIFKAKSEASYKPLIIWFLCLLATGINPYGFKLYTYLYNLGTSPFMNSQITELKSINFHEQTIFMFFIMAGIVSFGSSFNSQRVRTAEKITWLIALSMSLFSIRHVCFLFLFMPTFFAAFIENIVNFYPDLSKRWSIFSYSIDKIFIWCFLSIFIGLYLAIHKSFSVPQLPKCISTEFVQYIKNNPIKSPILSDTLMGSELLYFTGARSFLDTRCDMYGDKYVEKYTKLLYLDDNWLKTLKLDKVKYIAYQMSETNVNSYIYALEKTGWKQIYKDKKVILLFNSKI